MHYKILSVSLLPSIGKIHRFSYGNLRYHLINWNNFIAFNFLCLYWIGVSTRAIGEYKKPKNIAMDFVQK